MAETVASRTSEVCYVNADGELKCGTAISVYDSRYEAAVKSGVEAIPGISPNRVALILQLIDKVMQSPLEDSCVGTRSNDAVDSVVDVLATPAPIMLLYRYSTLPGEIMAMYYVHQVQITQLPSGEEKAKNNFDAARYALDHYAPTNLKSRC